MPYTHPTARLWFAFGALISLLLSGCEKRPPETIHYTPVSSGRAIALSSSATTQPVGSFPSNMITSADGRYVIVSDIGFRQSLWSISAAEGKGVSHLDFPMKKGDATGLYYGLAAAPDGTIYAAQGNKDAIAVLSLAEDGTLTLKRSIATRKSDFPAGLALDGRGLLYVTNNDPILPIAKMPVRRRSPVS